MLLPSSTMFKVVVTISGVPADKAAFQLVLQGFNTIHFLNFKVTFMYCQGVIARQLMLDTAQILSAAWSKS